MPTITDILVQYPTLRSLVGNLTTRDLFHLARASKSTAEIFQLKYATFNNLKQYTLCDGTGVLARKIWQNCLLDSPYEPQNDDLLVRLEILVRAHVDYMYCSRMFVVDSPSLGRCHGANAKPCEKCCIMTCEVSNWVHQQSWFNLLTAAIELPSGCFHESTIVQGSARRMSGFHSPAKASLSL